MSRKRTTLIQHYSTARIQHYVFIQSVKRSVCDIAGGLAIPTRLKYRPLYGCFHAKVEMALKIGAKDTSFSRHQWLAQSEHNDEFILAMLL